MKKMMLVLSLLASVSSFAACFEPMNVYGVIKKSDYSDCSKSELLSAKAKAVGYIDGSADNVDPKKGMNFLDAVAKIGALKSSILMIDAELAKRD